MNCPIWRLEGRRFSDSCEPQDGVDHETEDTLLPCVNYSQSDRVGQLTQVANVFAVSKQTTTCKPTRSRTPSPSNLGHTICSEGNHQHAWIKHIGSDLRALE
jgi:hypothetical protein